MLPHSRYSTDHQWYHSADVPYLQWRMVSLHINVEKVFWTTIRLRPISCSKNVVWMLHNNKEIGLLLIRSYQRVIRGDRIEKAIAIYRCTCPYNVIGLRHLCFIGPDLFLHAGSVIASSSRRMTSVRPRRQCHSMPRSLYLALNPPHPHDKAGRKRSLVLLACFISSV